MIKQIFNASEMQQKKLKATIQKTGKLGFTADTIEELKLKSRSGVRIANDDENPNILYLAVLDTIDETAFLVMKSGAYCYLNTKPLFDSLGMKYDKENIMFDLVRYREGDNIMGGDCYKMSKRSIARDAKKTETIANQA